MSHHKVIDIGCYYCSKPELWDVDFSDCAEEKHAGIAARGHFLKRIANPHYPAWPIQCIFRQKGDQHSKLLLGRDHFAPRWSRFSVEILGFGGLTDRPAMPPVPLFGIDHSYSKMNKSLTSRFTLWNACRIKHEQFDFVVKLHWSAEHDRIFSVDGFRFDGAAETDALRDALSIFAPGRGRKPSEYFTSNKHFLTVLNATVMKSHWDGRIPTQMEIAVALFPESQDSARELRRWLKTSWRKWQWKDIVSAIIEDETEKNATLSKTA
jgi:hypothetical protein